MSRPDRNIPTVESSASAWIEWYKSLRRYMNRRRANEVWLYAWEVRGGKDSPANTVRLRSYMSDEGVEVETGALGSIADFGSGVIGGVGSVLNFGGNYIRFIMIGMGVVLIGGAGLLVYNIAKDPKGAADLAARRGLKR